MKAWGAFRAPIFSSDDAFGAILLGHKVRNNFSPLKELNDLSWTMGMQTHADFDGSIQCLWILFASTRYITSNFAFQRAKKSI